MGGIKPSLCPAFAQTWTVMPGMRMPSMAMLEVTSQRLSGPVWAKPGTAPVNQVPTASTTNTWIFMEILLLGGKAIVRTSFASVVCCDAPPGRGRCGF
jgi:hypothetical protein